MREIIVAGNWKMHTNPAEAAELASTLASRTRGSTVTQVMVPPFVCLPAVRDALAGSNVEIGAQNIHHEVAGPYTGEVSARMLAGLATWVIVGHSERRRDAGETDALINAKLRRALEFSLRPILCVGEQLADRDSGHETHVVERQLKGALAGIESSALRTAGLVIAYEPVWAIGTGRSASPADAAAMSDWITRSIAATGWTPATAAEIPVLYGGSVTSANFGEFITEPGIDGALVGGASLKADEMTAIVARAGVTAQARQAAAG